MLVRFAAVELAHIGLGVVVVQGPQGVCIQVDPCLSIEEACAALTGAIQEYADREWVYVGDVQSAQVSVDKGQGTTA